VLDKHHQLGPEVCQKYVHVFRRPGLASEPQLQGQVTFEHPGIGLSLHQMCQQTIKDDHLAQANQG
jgi:hypothetical protein